MVNGVGFGKGTVSGRCSLSPYPAFADVVVIKVSPKVTFSSLGLSPVPTFFNCNSGTIHIRHVVAISVCSEFSIFSESILAQSGTGYVAIDFKATDRVGESDDSATPSLIEGVVRVIVGGEGGIELVPWTV